MRHLFPISGRSTALGSPAAQAASEPYSYGKATALRDSFTVDLDLNGLTRPGNGLSSVAGPAALARAPAGVISSAGHAE